MDEHTAAAIHTAFETFMNRFVNRLPLLLAPGPQEEAGNLKPFHGGLVPELQAAWSARGSERSFSTSLGRVLEKCAWIVAGASWDQAQRNFKLTGAVPAAASTQIDQIISQISQHGMQGNYPGRVSQVVGASTGSGLDQTVEIDLHAAGAAGEVFIEITSPKVQKGNSLVTTQKLLTAHAIRGQGPPAVTTYVGMAYNPFGGEQHLYAWTFGVKYFDVNSQLLVGRPLWDFLGGDGTYEALLEIAHEVGQQFAAQVHAAIEVATQGG